MPSFYFGMLLPPAPSKGRGATNSIFCEELKYERLKSIGSTPPLEGRESIAFDNQTLVQDGEEPT